MTNVVRGGTNRLDAPKVAVEALDRVRIAWRPHYKVVLAEDNLGWYFQIEVQRPDIATGDPGVGRGGKGYVTDDTTFSGCCRTIFGLLKAYDLHEVHEAFQVDGKSVYGPHIDVEALLEVAGRFDWTQESEQL
jgi:hypothetical protein